MQTLASRVLASIVVAALALAAGYTAGIKIERSRWLQIEVDRSNSAAETARIIGAAETARVRDVASNRVATAERVRAAENAHPVKTSGCTLSDPERLRLDAINTAYAGHDAPGGMSSSLPSIATQHGRSSITDHRKPAGLGLRMPSDAR